VADAFTHVLVAVDGSPAADAALLRAVALAGRIGANLTVLHVAEPARLPSSFDPPRTYALAESTARLHGERILADARALAGGVPLATEMHFGDPSEVICRRATELGADLVVVGSRGLGAIERVLLGSVSDAVIRCAPCSVLVVRGPD
jgi:nucleotide-binding universal stress UspA family protein